MFNMEDNIKVGEGIEGTDDFQDFEFRLKFTDQSWNEKSEFNIIFHDYAGKVLSEGEKGENYEKLRKYFLESQIVYVLIDTPYLMEATGKTAGEHSAKEQILTLFQEVGAESDGKMVAIVPTKCEYYLRNDQMTNVKDKIQRAFDELISYIKQLNKSGGEGKYKLYFTPVQTVGGLEYCKMKDEGGEQVATFRRTRPGSHFEPRNTDLLLLFCLKYVFENLFKYLTTQIEPQRRNKIIKSIEKSDDEKVLADCIKEYRSLETKNKNNKELIEIFRQMLQAFFSEYSKRESIIGEICGQYDEIKDCHIIDSSKKKLEKDFESDFRQHFSQL